LLNSDRSEITTAVVFAKEVFVPKNQRSDNSGCAGRFEVNDARLPHAGEVVSKAKVLIMPMRPDATHLGRPRRADPRFIEGQRMLVEAIRYLVRNNPEVNVDAVELLSEHFRTKFRMSDTPLTPNPYKMS
jgi:hypothetical protein